MQPTLQQNLHPFIVAVHCKNTQAGLYNRLCKQLNHRINWIDKICSFNKLIEALKQTPDATVLLCTRLDGFNRFDSLDKLHLQFPAATVILISEHYCALNSRLVKDGKANAYLLSVSAMPNDYVHAIDACLQNQKYYPADVAQFMLQDDELSINLDDIRIRTILDLMLQSKPVCEISLITKIPESTVRKKHDKIKAIAGKHKYGIVGYALQHHIITMEMVG